MSDQSNEFEEMDVVSAFPNMEYGKRSMIDLSIYSAERIADAIHKRMARAVLTMPAQFHVDVIKHWMAPPMQIPMETYAPGYYLLNVYTTANGALVMRIKDYEDRMIKEWVME